MEATVEIIVLFGVGVILIGLITTFVYLWNINQDVTTLGHIYKGDTGRDYTIKMDRLGFYNEVRRYWDSCNQSIENSTKALYVYFDDEQVDGNLTKKDLFDTYKSMGWCEAIQSANFSCGKREDVRMEDAGLPRVVRIRCINNTMLIGNVTL
jgi:hypothetical protein